MTFPEEMILLVELDLSAKGIEQWVPKVFIDPDGRHSIFSVCSSSSADTYYLHGKWRKPRMFSRLKGSTVSSVGWNRTQINEAFTREVILGTTSGQLYETAVEENDEKFCKLLFELTEAPEPFIGVQMEVMSIGSATRYFIMTATPSRLYIFQGTGSLEAVFKAYSEGPSHFTELPGEISNIELQFYGKQRRAERFAWLSGSGIYHGHLNIGNAPSANHTHGEDSNVEHKWLLEYSKIWDGPGTPKPLSLVLSEFHFLILMNNMLELIYLSKYLSRHLNYFECSLQFRLNFQKWTKEVPEQIQIALHAITNLYFSIRKQGRWGISALLLKQQGVCVVLKRLFEMSTGLGLRMLGLPGRMP